MLAIVGSVLLGLVVIAGGALAAGDPSAPVNPMTAYGIGIALFAFAGLQWYLRGRDAQQ